MKRGHVPRLAAQLANFGLFLCIIGVCGFLTWQASQYQAFVVPDGYMAGYVEQGNSLWMKGRVCVFPAGAHPVLENEEGASSPAYHVGTQSVSFESSAEVDVSMWKDVKNLLTRGNAPKIRVVGQIEASVTEKTVEALLLSDESLDNAIADAVNLALTESAKENAMDKASLETALLGGLEERLTTRLHLSIRRIQVDEIAEVDELAPTSVLLPSDFVVETEIVNRTPPTAYTSVGLAVLVGAALFLVMRVLFADLIALVILTPFQWVGLVDRVRWRVPQAEKKEGAVESLIPDIFPGGLPAPPNTDGVQAAPSPSPSPVDGPTLDPGAVPEVPGGLADGLGGGVDAAGELASGAGEMVAEVASVAVDGVAEMAGGFAEAALGGCAEGCLGGIFG